MQQMRRLPIHENELAIGSPLDFAVIDSTGTLLLDKGAVVATEVDRQFFFEHFTPHRLVDAADPAHAAALAAAAARAAAPPPPPPPAPKAPPPVASSAPSANDPVQVLGLTIGARLGVRLPLGSGGTYSSRVIGVAPSQQIFVTPPMLDNARLDLAPGEPVEVVAVSDRAIFLFTCTVESARLKPCPYVVLSEPGVLKRIRERKIVRVKSKLAVQFSVSGPGGAVDGVGIAQDISAMGLSLATDKELAAVGEEVRVAFYLEIEDEAYRVEARSIVRNMRPKKPGVPLARYGLQFIELTRESRLALKSYIMGLREG